jgi:hypothetical protein
LIVKDLTYADHCLTSTKADWCFRLCDDAYGSINAFDKLLESLYQMGDPKTQTMVVGNCVHKSEGPTWWLQGGAGWAMSRRAIKEFLGFGDEWALNASLQEDAHFSKALIRLGLNSTQVDSPYFSGHFLWPEEYQVWDWKNSEIYKLCPEEIAPQTFCSHRLVPYSDIVFHHSARFYMGHKNWTDWLADVPDDAMIWYDNRTLRICRRRND